MFIPFIALVVLFSFSGVSEVKSENILVISFFSSRSHKNVYEPLLFELAKKGHKLTMVSPFKSARPHPNIVKEIIGENFEHASNSFEARIKKESLRILTLNSKLEHLCNSYYEMDEIKQLLKTAKFDLIIGSYFWNECTYGIIHHFKAPFILIHPNAPFPSSYQANGSPIPLSFLPLPFSSSNDNMNFRERLFNWGASMAFSLLDEFFRIPTVEAVYKKHLGQHLPSVHDIERNVSLILTNSHFSLNYPRPQMPDMIDVGGMHCRPANPVEKELDEFLKGSGKDGFIYFSLGSVVKASTMPDETRKILLRAFSQLKQRVLWKWETNMTDLPPNVRLGKWLPQQDILGHPNIRMFITHGGLLSTEEAVYHGVPLVGIPVFGDQDGNMKKSEKAGFALTLEFTELTEEKIISTVNTMLTETKYKTRVQELSVIFKDRPEKPLDKAIYWTEYVMRHKGATHLRSPARFLNTIQYHSLDVIAAIISIISIVLYILIKIVVVLFRKIYRVIFGGKNKKTEVDIKKKKTK